MGAVDALLQAMNDDAAIVAAVATFSGTSDPIIVYGTINEGEEGLPAISSRSSSHRNDYGVQDRVFVVNCYAATAYESDELAELVMDAFRSSIGSVGGFSMNTDANTLGQIPDPRGDAYNTPVQVRVISIGG